MDLNRLSQGERIILFASAALFICSFAPLWASYSLGGLESDGVNAWSAAWNIAPKLAVIAALVALGLTAAKAGGVRLDLPTREGVVYAALGGAATLLLLIAVLTGPKDLGLPAELFEGTTGFEVDRDRGLMLFLGLALAAAVAYGGYLHMTGQRGPEPLGSDRGPTPTPPPAS